MENIWPFLRLYLGLLLLNACEGYPIDSSRTSGGATEWTYLSPALAVAFLMAAVVLVTGCVCCRQNKGFQEFTDSASSHSLSGAGGGYVNSAATTTEFTIFPPAQTTVVASHNQPGDRSSVVRFEPLPDIKPPQLHTRRPAAFNNVVNHGLSAEDWFQDPHVNFPRQQLKYVRELGCGWFGRVVEGEAQGIVPGEKSTRVVVKILHEDATTTDQMYFLHEVKPYRDLSHPNVLRLLGRCLETDPFLVLLESCPSGDLKSFLSQNIATADALNKQGITLRMACNISDGLQHLHNNGFVHTDLAARNCLVTPDLTVKVGDYGTSIDIFKEDYYCAGDVALPIRWCAPETLHCTETTIETKEVTQAANVWSLGVVFWEICEFGKLPYTQLSDDEVIVKVLGEASYRLPPPSVPSQHGQNMYLLMKQCWGPQKVRPALAQVCAMLNHLYSSWERYGQDGDNTSLKTDEDFERRWEMFKPNTIPKTDNHVPSKDSTPVVLSPAHQATEKPQLQLCTDTLSVDRNSITPLTTSPQPSLASSSGGDFYLPTLHQRHKSPSLQNLHGSIEDLSERVEQVAWQRVDEQDETSSQPSSDEREKIVEEKTILMEPDFDSWLRGVETTNEEDAKFVRKISEAIRDLDNALALEKTSSSSSSEASSHCTSQQQSPAKDITNVMTEENVVLDFRLGRADSGVSSDDREMTFQPDSLQEDSYLECAKNRGTDSGTDTEDETWRRRIERGEFSEKVKEKSKSVADLMILTHIECSDGSDSEPPSLTWSIDRSSNGRGSFRLRHGSVNKNTPMLAYSSEKDIHGAVLGDDFRNTLKRLQAEVQRTVAKHIFPPSDSEEQALLPSNHNRDENFLVNDASEETQKKSKIDTDVSYVPEENSGRGITLVDNVPQTNVIECCNYSLNGKGNTNDTSQCHHSIHTQFISDGGEENICSIKLNEQLQNTSLGTQPNSCQKMESKISPLKSGILQTPDVDTTITSKVAMGVISGIENKTLPLQLEVSDVSDLETVNKNLPVLVDVVSSIENKTSPLQSKMSCVSDVETISQDLSAAFNVTSSTENKSSPLQSETTSQGLPVVVDVASRAENKLSPLWSDVPPVSDIETISENLSTHADSLNNTANTTSAFHSEISPSSNTEKTNRDLLIPADTAENKISPLESEISHVLDIEKSQGQPAVDVMSHTENRTSPLRSERPTISDMGTTYKIPPVDTTSSIQKQASPLQFQMPHVSNREIKSESLPVAIDLEKKSSLQYQMRNLSSSEITSENLPVAVDLEKKSSPQSHMSHVSKSEITSESLPVDVDPEKKSSLQTPRSHVSNSEGTSESLPVAVDLEKKSSLQTQMSHVSNSETTSESLPVAVDLEKKSSPQSQMFHVSNSEITSESLPVADDLEKKSSPQCQMSHVSNSEITPESLPVAIDLEKKSSPSQMFHVSNSEITPESLPVAIDLEKKSSSSQMFHVSNSEITLESLPVADDLEKKSSPQCQMSHVSNSEITPESLPVAIDLEKKSSPSQMSHVSNSEITPESLPVAVDLEKKSSPQSQMYHVLKSEITPECLPVAVDLEKKSSPQSQMSHVSNSEITSLPVAIDLEKKSSTQVQMSHVLKSESLPVAVDLEKKSSPQSQTPHVSKSEITSLPVAVDLENKTSPLHSETSYATSMEITSKSVPLAVEETTDMQNKISQLKSDTCHPLEKEITSKSLSSDTDITYSTKDKTSALQSEISPSLNIKTIKDLPIAVDIAESKILPLQSEISAISHIEKTLEGPPVAVDIISNKDTAVPIDTDIIRSTENFLKSEMSHASETIPKALPCLVEITSTDIKTSPLKPETLPSSPSKNAGVVQNAGSEASALHLGTSGMSERISNDLAVSVHDTSDTESKYLLFESEMSRALEMEATLRSLPVAVDMAENNVSPLQPKASLASDVETATKDLSVAAESTENKSSPLPLQISHVSVIESKHPPAVENTEKRTCPIQSPVSHSEKTSKDLLVSVESNESSTSDTEMIKGLPVAECTINSASALQSPKSHHSALETTSKGEPVAMVSNEKKASSLQSEIPHAPDLETASKGLPVVESTEKNAFQLQSELSHASDVETIIKDLPVTFKSTESTVYSLQSVTAHALDIESTSKGLPAVLESTEEETSPLQAHALDIDSASKGLPVAVESTENKTSPLQTLALDIESTSKGLSVAMESTENKTSPLQTQSLDIDSASKGLTMSVENTEDETSPLRTLALDVESTSKGLAVAVERTEKHASPLDSVLSCASNIETAFKDLPVAVESTENKVSSLQSETSVALALGATPNELPVAVSAAENKRPLLPSEISRVSSQGLSIAVDVTPCVNNKTPMSNSKISYASKTTEGLPVSDTRSPDGMEDAPSVILGACEDYTLDYFKGIKSTLEESQPKNMTQFENACSYEQQLVDYSIDSWEKHLSSAFRDHEEKTDPFDVTFKESATFFYDEDDSIVELYIDQPQGSNKMVEASDLCEEGKWNSIGLNQASNFLAVGHPASLTSRDILYMEEKLKSPGLCIPSLNVIAATPVPSGRSSPESTVEPVPAEVKEPASENAGNAFDKKTDEKFQNECDPCFNFPLVLNDGQQNEDSYKHVVDTVELEPRNEEEKDVEKSKNCDRHYVEHAIDSNKLSDSDICLQDATKAKALECENKIECVQNVLKKSTSNPEDDIHNEVIPNDVHVAEESKAPDIYKELHKSHKQDANQTKTEQLSTVGSSQEDLLIAEDSVFGRPKSFVQDLFSPELMKPSEQLEFSVSFSEMESRQGPQVFGEKEANQVSAALNSWKQSGQQNRMLMEDFLLGERLASGPFEEEEMAKQSTPDDERSSDSGFRDKGSLSESCDDACDEKYHLEDIEAELEESNKSGYEREKSTAAQDDWLDKLPAASGKMFQDDNPSISTNSQAALSLSVDSDKDVYSDSVFTSEVEGGFGEKETDTYFSSGAISEEQEVGNVADQDDTNKSGWYLHPPVRSQELSESSGWTTSSRISDNNGNDNSYVSFNLEEEFVTAIRNELREKLPCSALHQQQEMEEEEEEEDMDDDEEERRDIVIHYNTYPAPLSPILEERESVSSITTTLSDHVSPFAHPRDILKSGSDSEPLSPVFMLDPKEEAEEMDAKHFEQDIREALENCSISSEEISSLSDENAKKSSVLFEDLEHQSREGVVVVRNTNNNSEDDDLLVVDTETNEATLLESPKPKSHLAFVRKAVEESVATPSDDEELTVGINTDTYIISKSRFSDDNMLEKQKNMSSDEEVYTPDSISPENAVTASSLFSPDTENMSDFFLTPSEKSPSNNGDLLLHNLNNNTDTAPVLDTVQELVANNEAAEIMSELQNASICNNNSILLFNANNNDNIVPEMSFKRNITVEDNWLGSRVAENDNNVIISVEQIDESSDKLDRLGYLRSPNLEVPREESEERDWSLPNLDATLLSTKAPMPSPEEESWKQIPSMLAFSDLNEVMARCGNNAEEEEEEEDEDPYPYQVDDNDLMSTSFSVNPDEQECYTPDWESGDSEDDNNSSSSGEFIWKEGDREASLKAVDISAAAATAVSVAAKYDGLSEFPMEVIAEEDEDEEEEDDADGSSSCGSGTEFVPSAWNSEATPNRSALRSPDKRSDHKKNVSFKKQKYHCVYEYPRETSDSDSEGFDSPTRRPHWSSMSYQQPVVDYASFADWELLDADTLPADSQDTDTDPDDNPSQQQLDFYKLSNVDYDFGCGGMVSEDGEFFISSSARPFQFSGVGSNSAEVGGSQFFPGATAQVEDVSLDFITPDSGITDMNVQSVSTVEPREEDAEVSAVMSKVSEWEPDEDAVAVGCDEVPPSPSSPMSPSGLGELRHTRDRLKLDLPTKNTAFVLDPPALGKRKAVETVKGEASLLDSGEETEDSGIESSNGALTSSKTLSLADNMKDTKV